MKKENPLKNNISPSGAPGRALALLPIGVFLGLFLGMAAVTESFDSMPAIVGFLLCIHP